MSNPSRPISGQPVPQGYDEQLWDMVNSMRVYGDGKTCEVSHRDDGQFISLLPLPVTGDISCDYVAGDGIVITGRTISATGGGSTYTLPIASTGTLGGIQPSDTILVNSTNGTASVPIASDENLGVVKTDRYSNIIVDSDGVIDLKDDVIPTVTGTGYIEVQHYGNVYNVYTTLIPYTLPSASTNTKGGVVIGSGVTVSDGTISVGSSTYSLPIASADTLGGIKVGSGLSINTTTGVLDVTGGGTSTSPYRQFGGMPFCFNEGSVNTTSEPLVITGGLLRVICRDGNGIYAVQECTVGGATFSRTEADSFAVVHADVSDGTITGASITLTSSEDENESIIGHSVNVDGVIVWYCNGNSSPIIATMNS